MIKNQYVKTLYWIERKRFLLLLLSTILTLVLPAFSGTGRLSEVIFVITLSFLFIQSMIVANVRKSRKLLLRVIVISLIGIIWLKPVGFDSDYLDMAKLIFIVFFFVFIMSFLIKFVAKTKSVTVDVLFVSINIYLLAGIIGASLSMVINYIYPEAYNFPSYIKSPVFSHYMYYSFITMSTVGYGDITPRIPESQTLSYFISIAGQLYVAIIIAFLVGKLLMENDQKKKDENN